MIKRTFSTVFLWLAIGGLLYFFGAPAGALLIAFLAAASQRELYSMLEKCGHRPLSSIGIALGLVLLAIAYFVPDLVPEALAVALVGIAAAVLACKPEERVGAFLATASGLVLIPFLLHCLIRVLHLAGDPTAGLILAFWIVLLVKFSDIGAYLIGTLLGRHKLAPSLSPGKTWEGAAGGLIVSAVMSAVWIALFPSAAQSVGLTPIGAALAALPIAAVGIVSDLLESAFKRAAKVKDSGNSIPGIGGAFDLTDSLILSVPVAYVLLLFFSRQAAG